MVEKSVRMQNRFGTVRLLTYLVSIHVQPESQSVCHEWLEDKWTSSSTVRVAKSFRTNRLVTRCLNFNQDCLPAFLVLLVSIKFSVCRFLGEDLASHVLNRSKWRVRANENDHETRSLGRFEPRLSNET